MRNEPCYLDKEHSLFGIVSYPDPGVPRRRVGVVLLNSGTIHNVGPFRLYVDFVESLRKRGFPVLRLDQTGKGESSDAPREASDAQTLKRDLQRANAVLSQKFGVDRFVIIGLCSGADDGLQGACLLDQVAGLVMLDGWAPRNLRYYVARYGPKLRPKALWARMMKATRRAVKRKDNVNRHREEFVGEPHRRFDPNAMWSYALAVTQRKIPIFAIYTQDADEYYSYHGQLIDALGSRGIDTSRITEAFRPDRKHLFPIKAHRDHLVREVSEWLCSATESNDADASRNPAKSDDVEYAPPPNHR